MRRVLSMFAIAAAACVALAGRAHADPQAYLGAHPIDLAGHWHDAMGIHVHDTLPVGFDPFADVSGPR